MVLIQVFIDELQPELVIPVVGLVAQHSLIAAHDASSAQRHLRLFTKLSAGMCDNSACFAEEQHANEEARVAFCLNAVRLLLFVPQLIEQCEEAEIEAAKSKLEQKKAGYREQEAGAEARLGPARAQRAHNALYTSSFEF